MVVSKATTGLPNLTALLISSEICRNFSSFLEACKWLSLRFLTSRKLVDKAQPTLRSTVKQGVGIVVRLVNNKRW